MMFRIHVSLILLVLLMQVNNYMECANIFCTAVHVQSNIVNSNNFFFIFCNKNIMFLKICLQVHKSSNCAESIKSMVIVSSCPTSKEKWDLAASKKHCETHALRQNCTHAFNFVYHCVINQYRNETLEVCAEDKRILGNFFF